MEGLPIGSPSFRFMSTTPPSDSIAISRSLLRRALGWLGVVVALVILALILAAVVRGIIGAASGVPDINGNEYQAVFLTNGQVYFGHLSTPNTSYYELTHVYYLSRAKGGAKLNKLIDDVDAPEDQVIINRSEVIYIENLRPNGKASRLISSGGP